ncbi:MAG: nucleotide exchange factor GrpE [Candidatus Wildermuthbacteria bacterium]|nr:nucleotide exchange factor GrpE [Candidatus Wildermuthbacteria bacterium]
MEENQQSTTEDLQKQLEQAKMQAEEYLAGWKRERADFLNYKKEEQERLTALADYAKEKLLYNLLVMADGVELAEKQMPDELKQKGEIKGLLQVMFHLKNFLVQQGVQEMDIGKHFDPALHETVAEEEKEAAESGDIIEVMQKGYLYNGKVFRPAKVKVAK